MHVPFAIVSRVFLSPYDSWLRALPSWQEDGQTPLHMACFNGHDIAVSALLKHDAIDIDRLTVQFTCMRCGDTLLRMCLAFDCNAASNVLLLHL